MKSAAVSSRSRVEVRAIGPILHPFRQKAKYGLFALSFANLCLLTDTFPLLDDGDRAYFYKSQVGPAALLALALNIVCLALLTWFVVLALDRLRSRWLRFSFDILFLMLLLLPVNFFRMQKFHVSGSQLFDFFKQPFALVGLLIASGGVLWQHRRLARVVAICIGIVSPLALFNLARIGLMTVGILHPVEFAVEAAPRMTKPVRSTRIIWILFDETDRRLAFDNRPANLQLPEFDRLRAEALDATNAYPPGASTILSLPALISGRQVSHPQPEGSWDLEMTLVDNQRVTSWKRLPSVFASARDLGFNTALVGWFHPYGRLFGANLNYCAWFAYPAWDSVRSPDFLPAVKNQLACLVGGLYFRATFANLCRESLAESLLIVTNKDYGLVFLHLPPPHEPGIYKPDQNRYSLMGMSKVAGYFNNLVLADHWLGSLRQALQAAGEWDRSWVLVSTDHSWRKSRLYDNVRDFRVPFILKAPNQVQPATYGSRFNTVITHDLVLAILRNQVTNERSAITWLDAHPSLERTIIGEPIVEQ